jgi:hypothetical protein
MKNDKAINKQTSLKPPLGEGAKHDGAFPAGKNYKAKEGRRLAPLPRRLPPRASSSLRRELGVGAADAIGGEDPHHGL